MANEKGDKQKETQVIENCVISSEISKGWFLEKIDYSCPGEAFGIKLKEENGGVLKKIKSDFQDIMILDTTHYGKCLVLDGIINCTERDEMSYQEMMTHIALCSHPNPKKVLIIGGGDGGMAREASKHSCVERVDQCEIDGQVIEACKEFLPLMSMGFKNPKVNLFVGDGFEYMRKNENAYDVIITDSSDPIGPAAVLFEKEYYELLSKALNSTGLLISQGESMWIRDSQVYMTKLLSSLLGIFPVVDYSHTHIPTYTTGQIGFVMASKIKETNFRKPVRIFSEEEKNKMNMKYYNEHLHQSAFVFPRFIQKYLDQCLQRKS